MKICLIVGSQRDTSESLKVAQYIAQSLQDKGMQTSMIALSDHALPRYDNDHNPEVTPELWKPFAETLSAADSFVIVTPEC